MRTLTAKKTMFCFCTLAALRHRGCGKIAEMFIHRIAEKLKQQQNNIFICLQFIDVFAIRIFFNILSNIIMKKTVNAKKENSKKKTQNDCHFQFF